jgi:hypothetical protein
MEAMRNSLILLAFLFLLSCDKDPRGVAHRSISDTYADLAFGKTIYSESLLRAVSRVSKLDSTYFISSNTEYILDWSIDTNARWYIDGSDSIIRHDLHAAGMEEYANYSSNKADYSLYITANDEDLITDLVVLQIDTTQLHVYEFVGEMPLDKLFKFGLTNFEDFNKTLNFNLLPNAASNTTNQ